MSALAAVAGHVGLTLGVMAALVALASGAEWATGRADVATVLVAGLAGVWGYVMRERAQAEHRAGRKALAINRWASNPQAARDVLWPLAAVLAVTAAVWGWR
jgi:hypothetical protein